MRLCATLRSYLESWQCLPMFATNIGSVRTRTVVRRVFVIHDETKGITLMVLFWNLVVALSVFDISFLVV